MTRHAIVTDEMLANVRSEIGRPWKVTGDAQFNRCATEDTIRHFCNAIGDLNPLFCNPGNLNMTETKIVHPDKVVSNSGARPGDVLILTKPIGTGIIYNGVKNGEFESGILDAAVQRNSILNKGASDAMLRVGVNACTDVTGFGLLGHLREIVAGSGVSAVVNIDTVPLFDHAREIIDQGFKPGMSKANRSSLEAFVGYATDLTDSDIWLMVDPQTSGGLLISLPAEKADDLLTELKAGDSPESAVVGEVIESGDVPISVTR